MIKTSYDPQADSLFLWLAPENAVSVETKEISPGIMIDYDAAGHVIGIEVLDLKERAGRSPSSQIAAE